MNDNKLVAGPIVNIKERLVDLKNRRSAELGKTEGDYLRNNPDDVAVQIPDPIFEKAKANDPSISSKPDFKTKVISGSITDKMIGERFLEGLAEWLEKAIEKFQEISEIPDFYAWLKEAVQPEKDPAQVEKIEQACKTYLGRDLKDGEFIPHIKGMDLLYTRVARLKSKLKKVKELEKTVEEGEQELEQARKDLKKYQSTMAFSMLNAKRIQEILMAKDRTETQ